MAASKMTPTQVKIQEIFKSFAKDVTVHARYDFGGYPVDFTMYTPNRFNYAEHMIIENSERTMTTKFVVKSVKDAEKLAKIYGHDSFLSLAEIESIALGDTLGFVFYHNFGFGIKFDERMTDENQAIMQTRATGWMNYHLDKLSWLEECANQ